MPDPAARVVVGASRIDRENHEAEHLLHDLLVLLGVPVTLATTHRVTAPWVHVAVAVECDALPVSPALLCGWLGADVGVAVLDADGTAAAGPPGPASGAVQAAEDLAARRSGRAVLFPGQDRLLGDVPLTQLALSSAIEAVRTVGGTPGPDAVLETRSFVRPEFLEGHLVLRAQLVDETRVVPWEPGVVHPCGGH